MCSNPCGGGGKTSSVSSSTAANATTVNVSTPVSINTADLADAIKALSAAQQQGAKLQELGSLEQAAATVHAAPITASRNTVWLGGAAPAAWLATAHPAAASRAR